eukprot:995617_1
MSSTILFLVLFPVIHGQIQIWYEKMNTSSTSWSGNPSLSIETSNVLCPTPNMYCWAFASGLSTKRTDNTTQFTAVQLVYAISGSNLNDQDRCVIEYSTDGTTFYDLERVAIATAGITNTFTGADLQPTLTIQLSSMNGSGHELTLQGIPVTEASVPTSSPLTSNPTKAPTYASPVITSCNNGTERLCYYVDIDPLVGVVQLRLITTQDVDPIVIQGPFVSATNTYFAITFNIFGAVTCRDPSIDLRFERIDTDTIGERHLHHLPPTTAHTQPSIDPTKNSTQTPTKTPMGHTGATLWDAIPSPFKLTNVSHHLNNWLPHGLCSGSYSNQYIMVNIPTESCSDALIEHEVHSLHNEFKETQLTSDLLRVLEPTKDKPEASFTTIPNPMRRIISVCTNSTISSAKSHSQNRSISLRIVNKHETIDTVYYASGTEQHMRCLMVVLMLMCIMCKCPKRISFNTVILMMVSGVFGYEYCNTAYECVGQSRPINRAFDLRSRGYKANSGGATDITIEWGTRRYIECSASFSCANIGYIKGSCTYDGLSWQPYLGCNGVFGCSNTSVNLTGNIERACSGSNSCYGVTFHSYGEAAEISCSGDRSCANTDIHSHNEIRARGSYTLYNASIHSTTDGLAVYLFGSNAGFGAKIFCPLGHSCTIYCYATGCNMLYVDCVGNCSIQSNSVDTVLPITEYSLFDESQLNILYDSSALAKSNDADCLLMFDGYEENTNAHFSVAEDLGEYNVCCRGSRSCLGSTFYSHSGVVCSGESSCRISDITATHAIFCSALNGCRSSNLYSLHDVYCLGNGACARNTITTSNLYCSGSWSCRYSTILNTETIYFSGYASGKGAVINCTDIAVCNIICDGYNSCSSLTVNCDECTVSCDRDTGCPPGYTFAPTSLTSAPTSSPVFIPTHAPTQAPTSSPTSECIDFHSTTNEINVTALANNITFIHRVSPAEQITGSDIAMFSSQSIYLNVTLSELHCSGLVSCFQSNIYCASGETHCNVLCNGTLSCMEATIHANNTQNAHIICDGEDTCKNVQIHAQNVTTITVDCVSSASCTAMQISLHSNTQSIISCYLMNSCDDINIFTTDYNDTQLHLYEYSENIVYDNGYGLEGIHCGTESQYVRYETSLTDTDIRSLIESEYNGPLYPCDNNIQIKCDQNMTDNVMNECTVDYVIEPATAGLLPSQCYWISIVDLVTIRCLGSCVTSPTEEPTSIPSFSPTEDTMNPTIVPTLSPSNAPSHAPSESPINRPTMSPSNAPSNAPSESPTSRPTLNPLAIHEFDYYIDITFILDEVNDENKNQITTNPINETTEIKTVIKTTYVGDGTQIAYSDLLIEIESIEGSPIESIDKATNIEWTNKEQLNLQSRVQCTEFGCASIKKQSQIENDFAGSVQYTLREHFNNDQLLFSVGQSFEIIEKNARALIKDNTKLYIFYGMCSIVCILLLIAIFAYLFNMGMFPQLPGFYVVDDAKWAALLIFSLQFWDFYTDINLAGEIWNHDARGDNMLLLVSAIGATFFVIIPYIANLAIAANIKHIVRKNQAAKSWFQYNTFIFTILVVVTGGSFPALALVSSGIFGMAIFTCGLTQYELKRMSKMKVLGTVVIENVPQLFCQAMYAYAIKEITPGVQLAFIASLLSVTASTLSYLIDRD